MFFFVCWVFVRSGFLLRSGLTNASFRSPAPPIMHMGMSMLARRGGSPDAADDDDGVGGEVLVVAVEE